MRTVESLTSSSAGLGFASATRGTRGGVAPAYQPKVNTTPLYIEVAYTEETLTAQAGGSTLLAIERMLYCIHGG